MKIKLGKIKDTIKPTQSYRPENNNLVILGETISIEKHSWDCGWYWGFGYIGNKDLHSHASVFITELLWSDIKDVFDTSIFKTNNDFWIFKDLLKQAYALKECAEVYRYGGHCITKTGVTDIIHNKMKADRINKDLQKVLNTLWKFLEDLYSQD